MQITTHGAPPRSGGAAAKQRWADIMGVAHPPTVSERQRRNRAATKAVGAGPQGRGGEAPELLPLGMIPRVRSGTGQGILNLDLDHRRQGLPDHDGGDLLLDECWIRGVPIFHSTQHLQFLVAGRRKAVCKPLSGNILHNSLDLVMEATSLRACSSTSMTLD